MTNPKPRPAPRAAAQRRNPSKPAHEMRGDTAQQAHNAAVAKVRAEWIAYREATPIAAETFMSPSLVAALNELAEEARS